MKKNLLIVAGDQAYAINGLNFYIEKLAAEYNIYIIEEKKMGLKNILSAIRSILKKRGIITTIDCILYVIYRALTAKPTKPQKTYSPHLIVNSINSVEAQNWLQQYRADIVIANGCSLMDKKTIKIIGVPILNAHPGVNPRYRGTGNISAILENNFHLIGSTIHYIDEGIDTGKIVYIDLIKINDMPSDYNDLEEYVYMRCWYYMCDFILNGKTFIPEEAKNLTSKIYPSSGLSSLLKAKSNYKNMSLLCSQATKANKLDL